MILKRFLDVLFSLLGVLIIGWFILIAILVATISTKSFGLFIQERVGQHGEIFKIFKIKSMNDETKKMSPFGMFLRQSKLDELPQLFNILIGQMSFVGPRPDVPGYADLLTGTDRIILAVKPGVTGLASLKYRNEETLLKQQKNPLHYNDTVIWPDKVRLNVWYVKHQSFALDFKILWYTFFPFPFDVDGVVGS